MLVFEDLQWADDLSLEIIAELARRSRDRQLLLVRRLPDRRGAAGHRACASGGPGWSPSGSPRRSGSAARPRDETALVTTLHPRHRAAGAARRRRRGLRADRRHPAPHRGAARRARAPMLAPTARAIREAAVPDTIEDAVLARLAPSVARGPGRSPAPARSSAAASCPTCSPGSWTCPPRRSRRRSRSWSTTIVLEPPGVRGLYDFRHQLLRDALYRSVPGRRSPPVPRPGRRVRRPARGRVGDPRLGPFRAGGLRRRGVRDGACRAPARRRGMSAHREAFELYRRAVDNMPADLDPADASGHPGRGGQRGGERRGPRHGDRDGQRGRGGPSSGRRRRSRPSTPPSP